MSDQLDPDEVQRLTRDALHQRAESVEPGADAYARLADKVATQQPLSVPWWQGPRMLWVGAASLTVAVAALAFVIATGGDEPDQVATPVTTPTAPAEPTPGESPTASATAEPTSSVPEDVIWPFTADGPWPASGEEAAATFYRELIAGETDPVLRSVGATPGSDETEFLVMPSGPGAPADPSPAESVATVATTEVAPGRWGVTAVVSGSVSIGLASIAEDGSFILTTAVSTDVMTDVPSVVVVDPEVGAVFAGSPAAGTDRLEIPASSVRDAGERLIAIAAWEEYGPDSTPAVAVIQVERSGANPETTATPTPTPTPVGGGADRNQGRPEGVIWPVEAVQPFGEWPTSPEDAAQQFVQQLGGWTLPVGEVTFLEPILMVADVELQFTGEDGEPFGTSTTVRVVGGFDEAGVQNWGVQWAMSDRIQLDGGNFIGAPAAYEPFGRGQGFEGVIEGRIVTPTGTILGEGFVTGGSFEPAGLSGSIPHTENEPGPGYVVFYDVGGLGLDPVSLTIEAVDIPPLDTSAGGEGAECSAAGSEPLSVDLDLPAAVEATRQAIGAAAIACDWAALEDLINDPSTFSYTFGLGGDPIGDWQAGEAAGREPMRFLVETLRLAWVLDDETGAGPDGFYIWPDVFILPWDDVTQAQRDALLPLYGEEDFELFEDIGFIGYRLAIDTQGGWRYFIAGD